MLLAPGFFAQAPQQAALARGMAERIERTAPRIREALVDAFFSDLAHQLGRYANLSIPMVVHVIQDDEPRALGLPNGIVLISSGLILRTQTEAAIAAIVSHEIGHIPSPPNTVQTGAMSIPVILIGCARFDVHRRLFAKAFDEAEAQADRLGLQYATAAGYDPEMVRSALGFEGGTSSLDGQSPAVVTTSRFEQVRSRLRPPEQARRFRPTLYR